MLLGTTDLSLYSSVALEKIGNRGVSYNLWLLQIHIKHSLSRPAQVKYLRPVALSLIHNFSTCDIYDLIAFLFHP